MQTFTEARHAGEFIITEGDGHFSRESVLIGVSQTILPGTVLGATGVVASETASVIAGTNTGNGVPALASPALSNTARDGDYILTATSATNFSVQTPAGIEIGPLTVGSAFNKEIKLTIPAGGVAFVAGDSFIVRVGAETPFDQSYAALNLTATDGTQNAVAIAIYPIVNDSATTTKISAIVRHAEVNGNTLTWPAGITAAQQAEAVQQLRRAGIVVR
jgi:hypothetical protein